MPPSEEAFAEAHAAGDAGRLVALYRAEADRAEAAGEIDRACFFLTQAYVWALEAGHPETATLHARLKTRGREE